MTSRLEVDRTQEVTRPRPELDIVSMFSEREPERYVLHSRHMNEMMASIYSTAQEFATSICSAVGVYSESAGIIQSFATL
jgi:hypothetical protein